MKIQYIIYIILLIIILLYISTFSCVEGFSPILIGATDVNTQILTDLSTVNTTINIINDKLALLKNESFKNYDSANTNSVIYGFKTLVEKVINGYNDGITTKESLQTTIDRIVKNMEYRITDLYGKGNQTIITDDIKMIQDSLNSIYIVQLQIPRLNDNLNLLKTSLDNLNKSNQILNGIITKNNTAITNGSSINANEYNGAIYIQQQNIGFVIASINVMLKNMSFIQTNLQNAFVKYGISWNTQQPM